LLQRRKSPFEKGGFRGISKFEKNMTTPISFEFFPPKTDVGAEKIKVVHQALQS
jgi:5,10-methylenetetrahydrofolate reductase